MMDTAAAIKAIMLGAGSVAPLSTAETFVAPPTNSPTPTAKSARPISAVARVSYFPCPYLWSLSSGLPEILTNTITMMSVTKSDSECTASATKAELWPRIPAMNLNTRSRKLTTLPIQVTLYIDFSRVWVIVSNLKCFQK